MKNVIWFLLAALLAASSGTQAASPPNTTASAAVPYEVGQGWVTHQFSETAQERWFRFGEVGRRSYCVEVVQGPVTPMTLDPSVTVYTDAAGVAILTTPIFGGSAQVTNTDGGSDPAFLKGARACYISQVDPTTTTVRSFKVSVPVTAGSDDSGFLRIRVVDTTLTARCNIHLLSYGFGGAAVTFVGNATNSQLVWNAFFIGTNAGPGNDSVYSSTIAAYTVRKLGPFKTDYIMIYAPGSGTTNWDGMCNVAHNGPLGAVTALVRFPGIDVADAGAARQVEMRPK